MDNESNKYSKYFEYYHKQRILYSTGKDKYKKCKGCSENKIFEEKNNKLRLNCGEDSGDCGDQFEIILPEYKDYYEESERLNKIIHGSFEYSNDISNIENYDLEKLDKCMDIASELREKKEKIEEASLNLKSLQNKYIKENKLKEKHEKIQELYNIKKKQEKELNKIMKKIKDPLTTDDKKKILRKEYAKTIYDNQRAINDLITELKERNNNYIKIKEEEITIMNEKIDAKRKEKNEKNEKKEKKEKSIKSDKSDKLGDKQEKMELEIAKDISDIKKTDKIKYYSKSKENKWLSTFNEGNHFEYDGYTYPTVEHAFHAQKIDPDDTKNKDYKERFTDRDMKPNEAKKLGGKKSFKENNYKLRKDWEKVKLKLMKEITETYYKNNPELIDKLLSTGNKELLHTGPRIDDFWGVNKNGGENHHGKILMDIRKNNSLRNSKKLTKEGEKWLDAAIDDMKERENN